MKSIWTGSISFGLVNIPIKLFSSAEPKSSVNFRLLHNKDKAPIKYKRVCSKEGVEVEWKDIVKGIESSKGKFITFTKEELEKLRPEKTSTLDVVEFIDMEEIDPIYFSNNYFIAPQKEKDKAFFLFKAALQSAGKLAVGRFVMREKEYLCTIRAYRNGLLLTTLNYSYEIRNIGDIEELKKTPEIKKEELALANDLINRLYVEEFKLSKFKDTFKDQMDEMINRKEKGLKIAKPKAKKTPEGNLMKALKASLK